ncbi:MAG TPA: hypothetical protein VKQ28_15645 [Candidatus Acidoferrum sp.]|nr:hypothetical protein [Candidatus Acidoferrum sp.]
MPSLAKAYIATVAAFATAVLGVAFAQWNPPSLRLFASLFILAMLASTMKIRLPGFKTTISPNFVFILIAVALFSFSETVLLSLGGALIQSLWKTQQRTKPIQVLFNASCLTVCAAAAFWISHRVPALLGLNSMAASMALGASVYVLLNTGLISLVISLAERCSLKQVWPSCYEWTFPYFLVGAALAGLAGFAGHGSNLGMTLLVAPVMYLVYVYYRMHIMRVVLQSISSMSQEHEPALVGASHGR